MIGAKMKALLSFAAIVMSAAPALADLKVSFIEGAPKDRFVITNTGLCDLPSAIVTVDLAGSAAGLVFDVTGNGPGVQVFQPFELESGHASVRGSPTISDGDTAITLELDTLASGQSVSFTIDVDDTNGINEITVVGHEILGATVAVTTLNQDFLEPMSAKAEARLQISGCSA